MTIGAHRAPVGRGGPVEYGAVGDACVRRGAQRMLGGTRGSGDGDDRRVGATSRSELRRPSGEASAADTTKTRLGRWSRMNAEVSSSKLAARSEYRTTVPRAAVSAAAIPSTGLESEDAATASATSNDVA